MRIYMAVRTVKKKKTIQFNFGDKHKDYIRNCVDNTFNIAERSS